MDKVAWWFMVGASIMGKKCIYFWSRN